MENTDGNIIESKVERKTILKIEIPFKWVHGLKNDFKKLSDSKLGISGAGCDMIKILERAEEDIKLSEKYGWAN